MRRRSSASARTATGSCPARSRFRTHLRTSTRCGRADVEPDQRERRRQIVEGLDALGDWADPNGVLEEVVFLVEKPVVVEGEFDERYLQLPSRVIETTIQHHIRAYSRSAGTGSRSSPTAATPRPCAPASRTSSRAGWRTRRSRSSGTSKVGIDGLAERLGSITFFAGGGTYADKTARLARLVEALGGGEAALEAARLAKADQASELVREFPELEGHVGGGVRASSPATRRRCARRSRSSTFPTRRDAPLPQTETGRVLAAADRIDTLNVSFELGQRPTGSRDPFGLRRAAIGL